MEEPGEQCIVVFKLILRNRLVCMCIVQCAIEAKKTLHCSQGFLSDSALNPSSHKVESFPPAKDSG
jgi:hypothetical protein